MCELGLMQKTGYDQWFWIAGIPSMKMALDIIENLRLKSEKYNPKQKTELPIQKNVFKISLLWGLINFQKN